MYRVSEVVDKEFKLKLVLRSADVNGVYEGSLDYRMTVAKIAP